MTFDPVELKIFIMHFQSTCKTVQCTSTRTHSSGILVYMCYSSLRLYVYKVRLCIIIITITIRASYKNCKIVGSINCTITLHTYPYNGMQQYRIQTRVRVISYDACMMHLMRQFHYDYHYLTMRNAKGWKITRGLHLYA